MGFFSFKTSITNQSIWNTCTGKEFPVAMVARLPAGIEWDTSREYESQDPGQIPVEIIPEQAGDLIAFREDEYEGYGEFGGVDFHALISFLNPEDDPVPYPQACDLQAARVRGIELLSQAETAADKLGGDVTDLLNLPKLIEWENWEDLSQNPDRFNLLPASADCPNQGYFCDA